MNGKRIRRNVSTKSAHFCYNGSVLNLSDLEAVTKNFVFFFFLLCGLVLLGFALQQFLSPRIVIEWQTASELDTVGFNILRAESSDGEPVRINSVLISPSNDPITGGSYSFEDQNVTIGATYFYYLEDVDAQGNTNRNGPEKVTASPGGVIEGVLALLLCIVSAVGILRNRKQLSRNGAANESVFK